MNWLQIATERLEQYDDVTCARDSLETEITRLRELLETPGGPRLDVKVSSTCSHEDWVLGQLVKLGELEQRQQQAQKWLEATNRALSALTPEEKLVLHRLFIQPGKHSVDRLCQELGTERSTVYRKREAALRHFTRALYGPV